MGLDEGSEGAELIMLLALQMEPAIRGLQDLVVIYLGSLLILVEQRKHVILGRARDSDQETAIHVALLQHCFSIHV